VVIANTADDVEIHNAHVSPDPDLCTFWLADRIDERGWGLEGDTFAVMDGLRRLGVEVWFNLGDEDLAIGLERARRLRAGERLTTITRDVAAAYGVRATVLPMSDDPVRTRVLSTDGEWRDFQDFMIRAGGASVDATGVEGVELAGIEAARPSQEVLDAIAGAEAIVIGPSNPVISIGPILGLAGMREALRAAAAPVVAVSPLVGGRSLKGPTEAFLAWAGAERSAAGVAGYYGDVLDGIVCDEQPTGLTIPALQTDTTMADAAARGRVARETLDFARSLAP
jgi:LPPG:FO 2-phospho-L-lactate transferase